MAAIEIVVLPHDIVRFIKRCCLKDESKGKNRDDCPP